MIFVRKKIWILLFKVSKNPKKITDSKNVWQLGGKQIENWKKKSKTMFWATFFKMCLKTWFLIFFSIFNFFTPQLSYIFGISDFFLIFWYLKKQNPNFFPKKIQRVPPLDFGLCVTHFLPISHGIFEVRTILSPCIA